MADLKVTVERIREVHDHPNADKLELAVVRGWTCIVGLGQFKPGDKALYVPIDSVIPQDLAENWGVAPYLKKGNRVRTVKLRGVVSQGILVEAPEGWKEGKDYKEELGVTKWEPPVNTRPGFLNPGRSRRRSTDYFPRYTNIDHLKNHVDVFGNLEEVMVTEKRHGTNFRFGFVKDTDKVSLWLRLRRAWHRFKNKRGWVNNVYLAEGCKLHVGSHNVILDENLSDITNVYYRAASEILNSAGFVPPHLVFFCEISGPGIQKGFDYGCGQGKFKVECMDIYDSQKGHYLPPYLINQVCDFMGLKEVPVLRIGYWGEVREELPKLLDGQAKDAEHIKEGVVIKPLKERWQAGVGRVIFKEISPEYLIKQGKNKGTDWH